MAPVVVNPDKVRTFADAAALADWLAAHHADTDELWLKLHKKGSGLATVSASEALDLMLCWGWIDAIRKSFDDKSFLQRYVPRGRKSIWSQVNCAHVERLIAEGRMRAPGLAQVEAARSDGRWDKAYPGSRDMVMPEDLMAAIAAEAEAMAMYDRLTAQNRFALMFRTHHMKTPAGRARKIADLVGMLKRGETPYPNGKS